ncbi:MAG: hypothetical protein Q7J16_03200 [Candidatus Cloacimonadales bacterium]|nr:hypothetical protein [Candidatus Cloacimonadales bacterium]
MFKYFNKRIKLFSIWDIKLAQIVAMCVMIVLIKLIPQITDLRFRWYILIGVVCAIRPIYVMFIKKEKV